ncbi:MAG TPA: histidine kinase [Methylophilaceae bacterium]|nr:histidine kinase [Methylophilaceae bacterium]HAJ71597.1 histidine kinase [Methylophilaceae bacterium]
MRIQYPNSFLKLLLIGFAFAILPLMFAFINANIAFDKLSQKSQYTITNAVKATRASLVLQEQLHLMERSIRQYFVLGDTELFSNYQKSRAEFNAAIDELSILTHQSQQFLKLKQLQSSEDKIYQQVLIAKESNHQDTAFLETYNTLALQVDAIIKENNTNIDTTSELLAMESLRAQKRFFLQTLILIPFTLLIAGIIAYMLGRPIQRMDTAIKDLGKGDYSQAISIDGPGNLRILGRRLDWLRQELFHLKKQKQLFLQHISHELKTPLTAIREATELLADGVGGSLTQQQTEITQILRDNSIRLQKMIENLLNFTKMESGIQTLNIKAIEIAQIIHKVTEAHALSIRNKKLIFNKQLALEHIWGDQEKLTIILDNLISNAVKFSPSGGTIDIISKQDKQWQIIEVKDTGPGLNKDDSDKLFDSFYQGKTLHQGLVNSSGLGLTIAKSLTEMHKGSIGLIPSEQGAHFVLRLPKMEKA